MAEWLKALVLKTRDGNVRRFESCPFRHNNPVGFVFIVMKIDSSQGSHRAERGSYILPYSLTKTVK